MPKGHLMVIDPGVLTPSIESFNRISKVTPLNVSYHLPALFGPKSLLKATETEPWDQWAFDITGDKA